MSELAPLIIDLALILICAGAMTLLFKKLKQPLVLGYIVAGFLASPHFVLIPSVIDVGNIKTWADIGVIFLLFALGLDFSFKKILKVGGPAIIAALTIIFGMVFMGILVGSAFGWKHMDSIFLGGMIAMSSTTIIYKAFEDLGLLKKQFTSLVLSVLILEDVLAVVLMVMLSTMALSHNLESEELLFSILKLFFFLVLWFVVGIYVIPLFLRRFRKLMNQETLLVVSLALCFGMVVMAAKTGFSAAFGAFLMGSILAETVEAESISTLVKPVKDLFGAIFFVSVGMMVDPALIVEYALPIIVITLVVIIGQATFGTLGVLLSGRTLKTAIQSGFCLTQIGEFAFIFASLGVSLKVTSNFLYPIVVSVSVITVFLTPYMIRYAEPVYNLIDRHLPNRWQILLNKYASGSFTVGSENYWKKYLIDIVRISVVYSIVVVAVIILSFQFLVPLCRNIFPGLWGNLLSALITVLLISPFLRAIMIKKNHSIEYTTLWNESSGNRAPLLASILVRILVAIVFVMFVLTRLFRLSVGLVFGMALLIIVVMIYSRRLKRQSILIERTFFKNLHSREMREKYLGQQPPDYAGNLLSKEMHLADYVIPGETEWAGKTLAELNFGKKYGVHVVSILRGKKRINIPKAHNRIFPQDKIEVIASDSELAVFEQDLSKAVQVVDEDTIENSEMILRQFLIVEDSPFLGKSLKESGIREQYHCLIAGVEKQDGKLHEPCTSVPFALGDILWIVGEKNDVYKVLGKSTKE